MDSFVDREQLASISRRLVIAEKSLEQGPKEYCLQDLVLLTRIVISCVRKSVNICALEGVIAAVEKPDIEALESAKSLFRLEDLPDDVFDFSKKPINFKEKLTALDELIAGLRKHHGKLPSVEVALRLEMLGDSCFSVLLMNPNNSKDLYDELTRRVEDKLRSLADSEISRLWDLIKSELFSLSDDVKVVLDEAVAPSSFFTTLVIGISERAHRCARYIVEYRPKFIFSMWIKGPCSTPVQVAGVSKVLALPPGQPRIPTLDENDLFQTLARVAYLWEKMPTSIMHVGIHNKRVLASELGVAEDGRLLDGPEYEEAEKYLGHLDAMAKGMRLISELTKLIDIVRCRSADDLKTVDALGRYRLGVELMCPEVIKTHSKMNELRLQKELCQYLLHQGIYSVGMKFGRNEADLLVSERASHLVIETKIYRTVPTESVLKKNLVQLLHYMNKVFPSAKGVLVIYNFSSTHISEPKTWFLSRFRILPINLLEKTPSVQRDTIELDVDELEIIKVRRIRSSKRRKKTVVRRKVKKNVRKIGRRP